MKYAVKLTQFGRKLNGKYGVTGVIVTTKTVDEIRDFIAKSNEYGMTVDVEFIGKTPN